MLVVENLEKQISGFRLSDICLHVPRGYIMGIIGENGAGKTTFIKTILGLYKKTAGNIWIAGMQMDQDECEIKQRLGLVTQDELFDKNRSLLANAKEYGAYYRDYDNKLFLEYATRFGLCEGKELKKRYGKVSRGERLKFELAFALSHRPELLVLDEPTANFDIGFRDEFVRVIKEFISDGERSVVIATHIMEIVDTFVDYVMYIENGKQLMYGDIESIRCAYKMVAGEEYKIRLLGDAVIHIEKSELGDKALIKSVRNIDSELRVWQPSMEEIMYYMSNRERRKEESSNKWRYIG